MRYISRHNANAMLLPYNVHRAFAAILYTFTFILLYKILGRETSVVYDDCVYWASPFKILLDKSYRTLGFLYLVADTGSQNLLLLMVHMSAYLEIRFLSAQ